MVLGYRMLASKGSLLKVSMHLQWGLQNAAPFAARGAPYLQRDHSFYSLPVTYHIYIYI